MHSFANVVVSGPSIGVIGRYGNRIAGKKSNPFEPRITPTITYRTETGRTSITAETIRASVAGEKCEVFEIHVTVVVTGKTVIVTIVVLVIVVVVRATSGGELSSELVAVAYKNVLPSACSYIGTYVMSGAVGYLANK